MFNMWSSFPPNPATSDRALEIVNKEMDIQHQDQPRDMTGYRFREGVERFFITDINNPAASSRAQSQLAVIWDVVTTDISDFNHVPAGGNVLRMDGHVEFVRYPGEHPMTRAFTVVMGVQGQIP
jgi:prepilin-type processing-associated H-X9-DG protein